MTKQEALSEIEFNPELGICYGRQKGCELMTFREFLNWYDEAGHVRYEIEYKDDIEDDSEKWCLRSSYRSDRRKAIGREYYDTYEEVEDVYYRYMEDRYNSDNGTGGIWRSVEYINEIEEDGEWGFDLEE